MTPILDTTLSSAPKGMNRRVHPYIIDHDSGKKYVEIPYVVKGMDVSFAGILTNLKQIANTKLKYPHG